MSSSFQFTFQLWNGTTHSECRELLPRCQVEKRHNENHRSKQHMGNLALNCIRNARANVRSLVNTYSWGPTWAWARTPFTSPLAVGKIHSGLDICFIKLVLLLFLFTFGFTFGFAFGFACCFCRLSGSVKSCLALPPRGNLSVLL